MACASETSGEWKEKLQHLLQLAADLCQKCKELQHITGINKLLKRCQSERKFLLNLEQRMTRGGIKEPHLASSNLSHLQGIVNAAFTLPQVTQVLQPFPAPASANPLVVDVVCNNGYTWVKIIARKAQALHLIWAGEGQFGDRCITHQALLHKQCAQLYPVNFTPPQIVFVFNGGVTRPMSDALHTIGISVEGEVHDVDGEVQLQLVGRQTPPSETPGVNTLENRPAAVGFDDDSLDDDDGSIPTASEYFIGQHSALDVGDGIECCPAQNRTNKGAFPSPVAMSALSIASNTSIYTPISSAEHSNYREDESINIIKTRGTRSQAAENNEPCTSVFACSIAARTPDISDVNLDVSTLICLASNVCNGQCNYIFKEKILNHQAKEERRKPLLPSLCEFLSGKNKFVCETAHNIFMTILNTLGGPSEKERAARILQDVTIVPDQPSARTLGITPSAKSSERAKIIFGTGDTIKAVTMTANSGFVRSAAHQGVHFAVWVHDSRALTEEKESSAEPHLQDSD